MKMRILRCGKCRRGIFVYDSPGRIFPNSFRLVCSICRTWREYSPLFLKKKRKSYD